MKDQEIKTTAITISTPDLKKLEELEKAGRENDSIENDNFPAESKALQIKNTFGPMVKMIEAVETEFNEIIDSSKVEVTKDVAKNARVLRLKIAKIRTGAETARKAQKASILLQGKAIDGACNVVKWAVSSKEEALEKIENHQKEMERLAIEELQADRVEIISEYYPDAIERNFRNLSDKEFSELVADKKFEAEEKEELRIENERLRKEAEERELIAKKDAEEKARLDEIALDRFAKLMHVGVVSSVPDCRQMSESDWVETYTSAKDVFDKKKAEADAEIDRLKRLENERIEKERAEKSALEAKAKAEREENEKLRAKLKAQEDAENARLEAEEKKRIESEMKVREISAIQFLTQNGFVISESCNVAKLEAYDYGYSYLMYANLESEQELIDFKSTVLSDIEIAKKKKAEAESLAKEQAEKKAIADKEALRQAELNKGDAEKVKELIDELGLLKGKYSFKSESNQKMYSEFEMLIDKTINHILK